MCLVGLLQVGCDWEQMVVAQNFGPSLERALCGSSELFVFGPSLEPGFLRSSEQLRLGLNLRAAFLGSSERGVCFGILRLSEHSVARACVWLQTWVFELLAQARLSSLERGFLVSGRSSDHFFARASLLYISTQQREKLHFFILFLFANPRSDSLSLSTLTFSLGIDLPIVSFYPKFFV